MKQTIIICDLCQVHLPEQGSIAFEYRSYISIEFKYEICLECAKKTSIWEFMYSRVLINRTKKDTKKDKSNKDA